MEPLLQGDEEARIPLKLSRQAIWFFAHAVFAIGSWLALMALGYALNPSGISQLVILLLWFAVTLIRQDEMAALVWLVGLIWLLIISLWILDMPTGPNACLRCDATEKLMRTFFSLPQPSGLIDNDGPFLGTWPAAALVGYSIGARMALKKKS